MYIHFIDMDWKLNLSNCNDCIREIVGEKLCRDRIKQN